MNRQTSTLERVTNGENVQWKYIDSGTVLIKQIVIEGNISVHDQIIKGKKSDFHRFVYPICVIVYWPICI